MSSHKVWLWWSASPRVLTKELRSVFNGRPAAPGGERPPATGSNSRCVLSYLTSHSTICLIDGIYMWHGGRTFPPPSDILTLHTHAEHTFLPSVQYSQLWHFLSAVLHFLNHVEIILVLLPSHRPFSAAETPQGDRIHQPSSSTDSLTAFVFKNEKVYISKNF